MTRPRQRTLEISHPLITLVEQDIFTVTFAPDCMKHRCRCRDENDTERNDACCQHGADVLVTEKAAILNRTAEIASIMRADRQAPATWFDERAPEADPTAPGGIVLRTQTIDPDDESAGCVFLAHTGERGCGLHRAALVHGFDPDEVKPSVCRLYPLTHSDRLLGFSPDVDRYSCANSSGPRVYRLMRKALRATFGSELIAELDRVEAVLAKRSLPILRENGPSLEA
jgi:hypothetical protein